MLLQNETKIEPDLRLGRRKENWALTYHTFKDIRGAEDAHHYLDGVMLLGRELEVQFAEGARKSKA